MALLVAGGQLDPNIGRLLRRLVERQIAFTDVLVGPGTVPVVSLEYPGLDLSVSGCAVRVDSVFLRHDAFWQEDTAQSCALNWYYLIRGWACARNLRMFNKRGSGAENNKIDNLLRAQRAGLRIPQTLITNDLQLASQHLGMDAIVKPVAGGDYTRIVGQILPQWNRGDPLQTFPRFVQTRLLRPEIRVYIVGRDTLGFAIESDCLDYREHHDARLSRVDVPQELEGALRKLAEGLGLDFGAADFMRHPRDGRYYFLEFNAQPMFAAFDIVSEGVLVDAMIDHLLA